MTTVAARSSTVLAPDRVSRAYNRAVDRNHGYDEALTDLREEIRGLADHVPHVLNGLIRSFFAKRVTDIDLVLAEASAETVMEGIEELSIECSSGPEGEGEVLLELYAYLHRSITAS